MRCVSKQCDGLSSWRGWIYKLAVFETARVRWVGGRVVARILRAPTGSETSSDRIRKALERVQEKETQGS